MIHTGNGTWAAKNGVDVIIGGHSRSFMDEPAVVNGIPIVQALEEARQRGQHQNAKVEGRMILHKAGEV